MNYVNRTIGDSVALPPMNLWCSPEHVLRFDAGSQLDGHMEDAGQSARYACDAGLNISRVASDVSYSAPCDDAGVSESTGERKSVEEFTMMAQRRRWRCGTRCRVKVGLYRSQYPRGGGHGSELVPDIHGDARRGRIRGW